jgi:hypothetical protein
LLLFVARADRHTATGTATRSQMNDARMDIHVR